MKRLWILILILAMAGVVQAQTFGDSTGSYSDIDATGRLHSVLATMPETGTLTHIKVFVNNTGHYNDYYFNFFIMTSDTILVDSTATYHYTSTMTSGWVTLPVVAGASLTARNYYIGFKHIAGGSGGPEDSLRVMRGSNAGSALARRDWTAYPALGQKNGSGWTTVPDYRYQILAVYSTGSPVDLTDFTWTASDTVSNSGRLQTSATFSNTCDSLVYWRGTDTTATNRSGFTRTSVAINPTSAHSENTTCPAGATWYQIDVLGYSGGSLRDSLEVHGKTKWVAPDAKICPVIK
jgi:hypothetical protein